VCSAITVAFVKVPSSAKVHPVGFCIFFFSSRRRHTRWPRDWSSDVCSSDLSQLPRRVPARAERRGRVGLLLGCVQRIFLPEVNAATARVLAAEGCEVIVPPEQGCCGALMVHAGLEEPALRAARRLIDVFERY